MNWLDQVETLLAGERRRTWRKRIRVPVQVVLPDDTVVGCELTEASPHGFRVRSPRRLPKGRLLTLRFPGKRYAGQFLEVPAEIVWNRSRPLGPLRFRCGGAFLPMTPRARQRLADRLLLTSGVQLVEVVEKRREGRLAQHAAIGREKLVVRDISANGVGLLSQNALELGSRVEVVVNPEEPIRCEGVVVWCRSALGGHAWYVGVRFDELRPDVRKALVRHLARLLGDEGPFGPS